MGPPSSFPPREPIRHKLTVSDVIDNSTQKQKNSISNTAEESGARLTPPAAERRKNVARGVSSG